MTFPTSLLAGRGFRPFVALRLAAKGLRRSPGTTLLAVAILSLGLALPSTFFSLLIGAIRPIPVPEGDRVVRVEVIQPEKSGAPLLVLPSDLVSLGRVESLEALGGFRTSSATIVDPGFAATRVRLAEMTPEVFPLLRVLPRLGRLPLADDQGRTLLIGHDVWQDSYGGDAGVLGRVVEIGGVNRTIVGVMPDGFGFPFNEDAWTSFDPDVSGPDPIEFVGRLAEGASERSATAELAVRWAQLDAGRESERTGGVLQVLPYTGGRGEGGEAVAFVGLVLVALCLLLIACANVANLLLVRATERVRALSIQSALGASRGQIAMQLLLEAFLVAVAGGLVGLFFSWLMINGIQNGLAAEHFGYFWMRMSLDGRVLTFNTILIVGTAVTAGMLPALRVLRLDVQQVLKEEAAGSAMGGGGSWNRVFVTGQLALSCGALVASGLTARAMSGSGDFAGDLPTDEILIASVSLDAQAPLGRQILVDALEEGLRALPGALTAAIAFAAPAYGEQWGPLEIDLPFDASSGRRDFVNWNAVTPAYFDALEVELLAGRPFGAEDRPGSAPVALVSQSFIERFSPDQDVLGRAVRIGSRPDSAAWHTIVGVVADIPMGVGAGVRHDRVYLPISQAEGASALLIVRARDDAPALSAGVRKVVGGVDPSLALSSVRTLADGHAFMTRIPRVMGAIAMGGGAAGLLVAAVGLYGLLAFRVRQRRRELGVRLALGADGGRLALDTLVFALQQLVPAIVIGLTLAWLAAPIMAIMLLGLDPRSPSTYAAVAAAFLAVGLSAAGLPAWRASLTDPATALRGH